MNAEEDLPSGVGWGWGEAVDAAAARGCDGASRAASRVLTNRIDDVVLRLADGL